MLFNLNGVQQIKGQHEISEEGGDMGETTTEPDYLYHFTSCDVGINKILKGKKLKFNRLQDTNDPYEYKHLRFSPFGEGDGIDSRTANMLSEMMNYWRLVMFRTACFSKTCSISPLDRPRMWSQYGDSQKGVCVVFNYTRLRKAIEDYTNEKMANIIESPVAYAPPLEDITDGHWALDRKTPERVADLAFYIDDYFKDPGIKERLLFTKDQDYEGEAEYRLGVVCWDDSHNSELELIPIANAIETIILGDAVPESKKDEVTQNLVSEGIQGYSLQHERGVPLLSPLPTTCALSIGNDFQEVYKQTR